MKIAMTGASGFVGAAAARCALERGHHVIRILRPGQPRQDAQDVVADLADSTTLAEIAAGVDAIIHCAASPDPAFGPISRTAVHAMLRGLPTGGRLVMQGGSAVFGDTGRDAASEPKYNPPPPLVDQAEFEREVLMWRRSDISTRVVYGSLIYGGRRAALSASMIDAAMQAGAALYFDRGDQVWSTAHVDDFGRLIVDAVECDLAQNVPLFAAGHAVELRPMATIIAEALGIQARPVETAKEARFFGMFADLLKINQHFASGRERSEFGWSPRISDNAQSLLDAIRNQATQHRL